MCVRAEPTSVPPPRIDTLSAVDGARTDVPEGQSLGPAPAGQVAEAHHPATRDTSEGQALGHGPGGPSRARRPLRELALLWLPVLAWAGVIFALSSIPSLGTGLGTWDLALRKVAHAGEYAVLALLLRRALSAPVVFALAVAYAISDEVHQSFVRGREGHPRDVAIDALGAALGIVAWRLWRRR